jgi:hypothetical protein
MTLQDVRPPGWTGGARSFFTFTGLIGQFRPLSAEEPREHDAGFGCHWRVK